MKNWLKRRKAKKTLFLVYHRLQKVGKTIPPAAQEEIKQRVLQLQQAVISRDAQGCAVLIKPVELLYHQYLKKSHFQRIRDFTLGVTIALVAAVLIRQMWFELFEIPTGSMRPTFKEQDRLSVSKTDFGINFPLKPGHFYFNPKLIRRNSIVVFTTKNLDFRDADTVYFYIFPGKKLLVKRVIGKPGDTLYFYGGQIYGIDSEGNDITSELQLPELSKIDHIPFISFEGTRVATTPSAMPGIYSPVMIYQMNEQIARLYALNRSQASGELLPRITQQNPQMKYDKLWGIGNFATARILTKEQMQSLTDQSVYSDLSPAEEGVLYLELRHHPNVSTARMGSDGLHRLRPLIGLSTSIIPLQEHHLKTIMDNLYTARFVVNHSFASRYEVNAKKNGTQVFFPRLLGVPDGTYEFYYGKAYSIGWQGISHELPPSHPVYWFDANRAQLFFNMGMEFDTRYNPQSKEQAIYPSRYAYFRNGDLYLMGAPFLQKNDPTLIKFVERESKRRTGAPGSYTPFVDKGPPLLSEGKLDVEKVKKYGLTVPPASYLVLGDNHANSGDSREFGFVPEANLKGSPAFVFWPPGPRFGTPLQPPYPFFSLGRVVIWSLAIIGFGAWGFIHHKRNRLPLKF